MTLPNELPFFFLLSEKNLINIFLINIFYKFNSCFFLEYYVNLMYKERKSLRLAGYDYSSAGIYFITICTRDRVSSFGKITDTKITLSEIGMIARQFWLEIPNHFKHVSLDDFVIMPNHLHGILILDYSIVGTRHGVSLDFG